MGKTLLRACVITISICVVSSVWAGDKGRQEVVVSLRADQRSLRKVLQEIERKSGYTIHVGQAVQDRKITVKFDNVPLSDSIRRLFYGRNYSVIFNNKTKEIEVVSLGKVGPRSRGSFKESEVVERKLHKSDLEGMVATDSVLALHKKTLLNPAETSVQPKRSPMTASSEVLAKHEEARDHGGRPERTKAPEKSPMTTSEQVLKLHRKGLVQGGSSQVESSESSPMSEVDAAMRAHREILKKK